MAIKSKSKVSVVFTALVVLTVVFSGPASAQNCVSSDITLSNQSEVNSFQADYGPCERAAILYVTGSDITNLDGLAGLTYVETRLAIYENPNLTDIGGLSAIAGTGQLSLRDNTSLTNLDGLSSLTHVDGDLQIIRNPALTNLDGLSSLSQIDGYLLLNGNPELTRIDGLSSLTHIGANLNILLSHALTNLDGLTSLTSLGGKLLLRQNHALSNIDGLSALTSIESTLLISDNDALIQVDGLRALTSVGGAAIIENNDSLMNLGGLSALISVNGNLEIRNNDSLIHLDGLSNLVRAGDWVIDNPSISEHILISDNKVLTNLNGLSSLTRAGTLEIFYNALLENVDGLSGITEVSGCVHLQSNNSLKNVDGFSGINSVGDFLAIVDNDSITDIEGLSALTQLGTNLQIAGNADLTNLDALSGVKQVPGNLFIIYNSSLIDLDGLASITEVGGALVVERNDRLTDLDVFAPLKGVHDLTVRDNLALSDCIGVLTLVDPIDDYEPGPGPGSAGIPDITDTSAVSNNAKGCNSVQEILAEVPLSTMNAGLNDAWFNLETNGQGFLVTVFPEIKRLFMAWFTYDTERPPEDVMAILGEPGHRWLTAQGDFQENIAELTLSLTAGGVFDSNNPAAYTEPYGEVILEFSTCNSGIVSYDIPTIFRQRVVPIERITLDNVPLCYLLDKQPLNANPEGN